MRTDASAWTLFRKHHYLDGALHPAARCFVALLDGQPVAFNAVLHFPHPKAKNVKRSHRSVCLPDYQGLGIGVRLVEWVGSVVRGLGYRFMAQTGHPAMIASRTRSPLWRIVAAPRLVPATTGTSTIGKSGGKAFGLAGIGKRLTASFEYVGPALPEAEARAIWGA